MTDQSVIEEALFDMAAEVEHVNRANGWYDEDRTFGDEIALLHSEASEMLEAFRDHGFEDATDPNAQEAYDLHRWAAIRGKLPEPCSDRCQTTPPKPEGVGSEAADVLIRLLDTCQRHGINLGAEYARKMRYNETRGYKHGGKRI